MVKLKTTKVHVWKQGEVITAQVSNFTYDRPGVWTVTLAIIEVPPKPLEVKE